MIIPLVILILIFLITGYISGNFLFNLALNPKTSKSAIFTPEIDEIKAKMMEENNKWLKENAKEVYIYSNNKDNSKAKEKGKEKRKRKNIKLFANEVVNKNKESKIWVITVHGYTDSGYFMVGAVKKFLEFGYNVLIPDLQAHGKSGGKYIGMGWKDRLDILSWIDYLISTYGNIKIILYGISMGAASVMMASGEKLPSNVRAVIEDCGYTSVWDEFKYELKYLFHMPTFPALYNANIITILKAGYSLRKASCVKMLKKSVTPTLFIHGNKDKFVPFSMLDELYNAANCKKEKLVIKNAGHAEAQLIDPNKYWHTVRTFIKRYLF